MACFVYFYVFIILKGIVKKKKNLKGHLISLWFLMKLDD